MANPGDAAGPGPAAAGPFEDRAMVRALARNWWALVTGVLLFLLPAAGALALALWIAAYMLVFGALLIAFGLRLRSWGRTSRTSDGHVPGGLVPRPARNPRWRNG